MAKPDLIQWVNLEKKSAYADGKTYGEGTEAIRSEERLGSLRVQTTFRETTPVMVLMRLVAEGSDNVCYSDAEKKRHRPFRLEGQYGAIIGSAITEGKETKHDKLVAMPPAGGNQYRIEAKYKGKVVKSKKVIEARRRLYYQVLSMRGTTCPASFTDFEKEFLNEDKKYFIELVELKNGRNELKPLKTIHRHNKSDYEEDAESNYKLRSHRPYSSAVVVVNNIAYRTVNENTRHKKISLPSVDTLIDSGRLANPIEIKVPLKDAKNRTAYLWHGLVPEHDAVDRSWLIGATITTSDGKTITIDPKDVSIDESVKKGEGGYSQVKINLSGAVVERWLNSPDGWTTDGEGDLTLETYVVDKFLGGFSSGASNIICIATRSWWRRSPKSASDINQVMVHEMGHKVGMVASGDSKRPKPGSGGRQVTFIKTNTPDGPDTLYGQYHRNCGKLTNPKGHQGAHCENGASYETKPKKNGRSQGKGWTGTQKCVMFGGTGMKDFKTGTYHASPKTFCDKCEEPVRKLDCDGHNIDALKNSI